MRFITNMYQETKFGLLTNASIDKVRVAQQIVSSHIAECLPKALLCIIVRYCQYHSQIPRLKSEMGDGKKKWILSDSNITNAECIIIAYAMHTNMTLESLHLGNNEIGDQGASQLGEALLINTALKEINISDNVIDDIGASAIATSLKKNHTLKVLWLRSNTIGNIGAVAVAEAIKVNKTLSDIYLNQNKIGNIGAKEILKALAKNTTLRKIQLRNNKIDDECFQIFVDSFTVNCTLTFLGLITGNDFSNDCKNKIKKFKVHHSSLNEYYS